MWLHVVRHTQENWSIPSGNPAAAALGAAAASCSAPPEKESDTCWLPWCCEEQKNYIQVLWWMANIGYRLESSYIITSTIKIPGCIVKIWGAVLLFYLYSLQNMKRKRLDRAQFPLQHDNNVNIKEVGNDYFQLQEGPGFLRQMLWPQQSPESRHDSLKPLKSCAEFC